VLLVLAMSVDPDAAQAGLPPVVTDELRRGHEEDLDVWPPAPPVTAKATQMAPMPVPAPILRDAPANGATEAPPKRARVALGGAISAEIQPDWAPGLQVVADLEAWHRWSLSLSLLAWQPITVEPRSSYYLLDGGVSFYAAGAVPAVCRALVGRELRLDACGGAHLGLRWLRAEALQKQGNPVRAFVAPSLSLRGTWQLTRTWLVQAALAVDADLAGQRFTYGRHDGGEVFLAALGAQFDGRSSFQTFLYGVCRNVARSERRRFRVDTEIPTEDLPETVVQPAQEGELWIKRAHERLVRALDLLDDAQREVFVLFEIEQLSMEEIAQAQGAALTTCYSRLYAAREKIQAELRRRALPNVREVKS
jgi:RNA polymerase sigma factor (sigma-70 family)